MRYILETMNRETKQWEERLSAEAKSRRAFLKENRESVRNQKLQWRAISEEAKLLEAL